MRTLYEGERFKLPGPTSDSAQTEALDGYDMKVNSIVCQNVISLNSLFFKFNTMDLSKFGNSNSVYYNDEMAESWDGTKFNLVRQFLISHFLMVDPKGHEIAGDVLNWIEDRLGNTVYEEFEF